MARGRIYICGPTDCPHDSEFEHDNYYGCVPKDFSGTTGKSKRHVQKKDATGHYRWNGGCDGTAQLGRGRTDD